MVDIQSAMAEIRRGKKRRRKKNKRQDENIYIWPALLHRQAIKKLGEITTKMYNKHRLTEHN